MPNYICEKESRLKFDNYNKQLLVKKKQTKKLLLYFQRKPHGFPFKAANCYTHTIIILYGTYLPNNIILFIISMMYLTGTNKIFSTSIKCADNIKCTYIFQTRKTERKFYLRNSEIIPDKITLEKN